MNMIYFAILTNIFNIFVNNLSTVKNIVFLCHVSEIKLNFFYFKSIHIVKKKIRHNNNLSNNITNLLKYFYFMTTLYNQDVT